MWDTLSGRSEEIGLAGFLPWMASAHGITRSWSELLHGADTLPLEALESEDRGPSQLNNPSASSLTRSCDGNRVQLTHRHREYDLARGPSAPIHLLDNRRVFRTCRPGPSSLFFARFRPYFRVLGTSKPVGETKRRGEKPGAAVPAGPHCPLQGRGRTSGTWKRSRRPKSGARVESELI